MVSFGPYRSDLCRRTNIESVSRGSMTRKRCKVGCVFPMVVVTLLLHAEFGLNDHREKAPHVMESGENNRTF